MTLERALGCSRVLAELLARLGVESGEQAEHFLNPRLSDLGDPFAIEGLDAAVDRLVEAINRREQVTILGDYDVDGVTSTAFLTHLLRRLGLNPRYVVPRRLEQGYGLSHGAVDRVLDLGVPDLFVALDCGTNSTEEAARLTQAGADIIILDHHRSKGETPAACRLVNPHVARGPDAAGRDLCTVGLVFKLAHGLLKRLRAAGLEGVESIRLRDYLDFVAMGTVADLVPLRGENRILARTGLTVLESRARAGLLALMEVSGIEPGFGLRPVDISFKLGPRINASGRLADAGLAVDLLLSDDRAFCAQAARELDQLNRDRQELERRIVDTVDERVATALPDAQGLVVFDETWHPGVVGVVASRVSRKYCRPSIVLGLDGDLAKGSGRSVAGLNLVDILASCGDLLESWGGHPMAVGISLQKDRVGAFQLAFDAAVRRHLNGSAPEPDLVIGAWLDLTEVTEDLLRDLERMHPFGEGNREPVFGIRGVELRQPPEVFREHHFRFRIDTRTQRRLFGVAWKMADRLPPVGQPLDLAVQLRWNYLGGRQLLQLELLDWRPAA